MYSYFKRRRRRDLANYTQKKQHRPGLQKAANAEVKDRSAPYNWIDVGMLIVSAATPVMLFGLGVAVSKASSEEALKRESAVRQETRDREDAAVRKAERREAQSAAEALERDKHNREEARRDAQLARDEGRRDARAASDSARRDAQTARDEAFARRGSFKQTQISGPKIFVDKQRMTMNGKAA